MVDVPGLLFDAKGLPAYHATSLLLFPQIVNLSTTRERALHLPEQAARYSSQEDVVDRSGLHTRVHWSGAASQRRGIRRTMEKLECGVFPQFRLFDLWGAFGVHGDGCRHDALAGYSRMALP